MNMSEQKLSVLAVVAAVTMVTSYQELALGAVVWDESINGSLSTDRFDTTHFGTLAIGSNDGIGTTVLGISKFFTFNIGVDQELTSLVVKSWVSRDDLAFLGVVTGDTFSVDPASPNVAKLLGYAHYGEPNVGQNILSLIGQSPGSQGFTAPLGPGDYSFWVRQAGPDPATWDLDFVVEGSAVVPLPSAIWMGIGMLVASGVFGKMRRRSTGR